MSNLKEAAGAVALLLLQTANAYAVGPYYPAKDPCTGLNPNSTQYRNLGCHEESAVVPAAILGGLAAMVTAVGLYCCCAERVRSCCSTVSKFFQASTVDGSVVGEEGTTPYGTGASQNQP